MKGGLLTGFHAVEVLQDAGFDGFGRITYVCNPDEEIGSPFSGPVIRELAPAHDAAFVLEGARANGDIVSARKGITDYAIEFVGRAAHAGVEPEKGANAVLAAANATVAMQALNGRWPGVTVNVGVARGGTRTNVVAERCVLQVDLRSPELATLEEAEAEIDRICAEHGVERRDRAGRRQRVASPDGEEGGRRASRGARDRDRRPSSGSSCAMPRPGARATRTRRAPPARRRSTASARSAATITRRPSGSTSRASCHASLCSRGLISRV